MKMNDAAPNWRPHTHPNHSGPALSSSSYPASEPDYPWLREYKKPELRQPKPQPELQPVSRELMPFGQRIRELRRARGWTQRQAGYALGVSRRTVIRHERGRTRRPWWSLLETVRRLEEAYAGELRDYLVRGGSR
jgi:DNA-binding XRE family transcriptional regulator